MLVVTGKWAVLFDMDGTLVDSEKLWFVALGELAATIGGVVSARARTAIIGAAMTRAVDIVHGDLGARGRDPLADIAWLEERVHGMITERGPAWQPGARELLTTVRDEGVPTALVTSSARRVTEATLRTLGSFDVVVTRDDVARPKPDPEPYRRAAELLALPTECCVAVEDSAAGVTSARAAGAAVIAVSSGQNLPTMEGVHHRRSLLGVGVADLRGCVRDSARRTG